MAQLMARAMPSLRIGITQRHQPAAERSFARDALDAGWSNWIPIAMPGASFVAIPNFSDPDESVRYLALWNIDVLILSGGENVGSSPRRDAVERALLDHARQTALPVIGVCRGMQMLHWYTGGSVDAIADHVGHPHSIFVDGETHRVNSWHGCGILHVAQGWQALARAEDGSIEAMRHADLPWLGIMWHPEREGGAVQLTKAWITSLLANR